MCSERRLLPLLLALLLAVASPAHAGGGGTLLTKEEALALAFEGCEVTRTASALSSAQRKRVETLSGSCLKRGMVYTYTARRKGKLVGSAYFDVSRVRTMRQVLMVVVDPVGKVRRVELLAFGEPKQFIPSTKWYAQFVGKRLDETLSLKRAIKGVTGATLTARATTESVRRMLAIHQTLAEVSKPPQPPAPKPAPRPAPKPPGGGRP